MTAQKLDLVIVGAGFGGMYMLHRARGLGLRARVIEAGGDVGGTWYWNRYPGARCDVESMQYSYQFSDPLQQEWQWTERYAAQPEILRYASHVADRFDLRRDIQLNTRVEAAVLDDDGNWRIVTDRGEPITATYCVMATGCLSAPNLPALEGRDSFDGPTYRTGVWPHHDVDFSGQRVAVIGTGSSAIQSIPMIAQQAEHVTVFQRTANYAVPAHNRPLTADEVRAIKADYAGLRARAWDTITGIAHRYHPVSALEVSAEQRLQEYEARWQDGGLGFLASFNDLLLSHEANATAADFVRAKIGQIVHDPEVAALLTPKNIIGGKRLCVDTDYYATYNRPNVSLVDVSQAPIERITSEGVRARGQTHPVDAIVYATGFDAMTGALLRIDIRGRGGLALRERWADGPSSYLGLQMAGFPNLFTITGPGSPSVLTNMLPSIEQHVNWIADCLAHLQSRSLTTIEPTSQGEDAWMDHVAEAAAATIKADTGSWYVGANIAGKPRVFMPYIGGVPAYLEKCADVVAKGYEGFALS